MAETGAFQRPGLIEEYSVSMDGVRQDFLVAEEPAGGGKLSVALEVSGASASAATFGAKLVLEGSGREIACHRLHVTDATGRELEARMEVSGGQVIRVTVDDRDAVYPVRIDPTFCDCDWISMGGTPGVEGSVHAIAADGAGNLYVGGSFTAAGGVSAANVAKWNGSSWSAMGDGISGTVYSLAVSGTLVYAGGSITGGVTCWNGHSWASLREGVNGGVQSLAMSGSTLYVGGNSTVAGTLPVANIARWSGGNWSALGSGTDGAVSDMVASGGNLYIGGSFDLAGGVVGTSRIARWDGSDWFALGSGVNGNVDGLVIGGGHLYVGGAFTQAGGLPAIWFARWNIISNTWSAIAHPAVGGFYNSPGDLAWLGGELYAITVYGDGSASHSMVKWNPVSEVWLTLPATPDYMVQVLETVGAQLFAGGSFSQVGDVGVSSIARFAGTTWSALGSGFNAPIYAMTAFGSDLYVGGDFTTTPGGAANRIAKWDGSAWSALGSGTNEIVTSLAVWNGSIYAGGLFTNAGGLGVNHIARWNPATSSWSRLAAPLPGEADGTDGPVYALDASTTRLYVGGSFLNAGGLSRRSTASWNGSSWSALGSGMVGYVNALAVANGRLFVGGSFKTAGGKSSPSLASTPLVKYSDGSLDETFGSGGKVTTLFAEGGAGARAIVVQPDGKILVAGQIQNGSNIDFALARYLPNGTPDVSFDFDGKLTTDFGANDRAFAIALQPDGKIVTGGWFLNGIHSDFLLARFLAGGAPDTTFDGDGLVTVNLTAGLPNDTARAVIATCDGQLVLAGTSTNGTNSDIALTRHAVAPMPEIRIEGNTSVIASGDTTPRTLDHTDFGSVGLGETLTRTFTIRNTGSADLHLTGGTGNLVSLVASPGSPFTVSAQPALDTIIPGGTLTFGITFTPTAPSDIISHTASVAIPNDDFDEAACQFGITAWGARFSDGTLDETFGTGGKVTTDFGGTEGARAMVRQPDGKILVVGGTSNGSNHDFALARYWPNGSLDSSFGGGDGLVTTGFGIGIDVAAAVVLQPDGRILVAGTSYNGSSYDFALARYDEYGDLDMVFGISGKVTTDFAGGNDNGRAIVLQSDGGIVVAGESIAGSTVNFALTRYDKYGILDPEFGAGGKVTTDFGGDFDYCYAVVLQPDGKLVVAGEAWTGSNYDFALARYGWSDGEIAVSGNGVDITDGDSTPDIADHSDFGSTCAVSGSVARVFTISNSGPDNLNLTGSPRVAITGAHAADFTVTALPASPVVDGASTTFTITFDPSDPGLRTATVSIACNDPDEHPFIFAIQGTGLTHAEVFEQKMLAAGLAGGDTAPLATPFGDGVPNLLKYAFNLNLNGPDVRILPAGGTAGLPRITLEGSGVARVLRYEFVARADCLELTYTAQKSTNLAPGSWQTLDDVPLITPLVGDWARVVYEEPAPESTSPRLFGRVEVELP